MGAWSLLERISREGCRKWRPRECEGGIEKSDFCRILLDFGLCGVLKNLNVVFIFCTRL